MMVLCKRTISLINHYSWLQIETLSNNIGTIYFFYHTYNSSKRMKQDLSIFVLALTYIISTINRFILWVLIIFPS